MGTSKAVRKEQSASSEALPCRRKFLRFFPRGFQDETYIDWERDYKWKAHEQWVETLNRSTYRLRVNLWLIKLRQEP